MIPRAVPRATLLLLLASLSMATVIGGDGGTSAHGWIGVTVVSSRAADGDRSAAGIEGITVTGVVVDSPAEQAGLRSQDRILMIDGTAVSTPGQFASQLRRYGPGSWIPLTVERRGREREIRVRLVTRPDREVTRRIREGWIGVESIDLSRDLRSHFGAPDSAGVMISAISPGSPAEAAGLEVGDVVHAVDGVAVRNRGELSDRIRRSGVGNPVEITLARDGAEITLEAIIARRPAQDTPPTEPRPHEREAGEAP